MTRLLCLFTGAAHREASSVCPAAPLVLGPKPPTTGTLTQRPVPLSAGTCCNLTNEGVCTRGAPTEGQSRAHKGLLRRPGLLHPAIQPSVDTHPSCFFSHKEDKRISQTITKTKEKTTGNPPHDDFSFGPTLFQPGSL